MSGGLCYDNTICESYKQVDGREKREHFNGRNAHAGNVAAQPRGYFARFRGGLLEIEGRQNGRMFIQDHIQLLRGMRLNAYSADKPLPRPLMSCVFLAARTPTFGRDDVRAFAYRRRWPQAERGHDNPHYQKCAR